MEFPVKPAVYKVPPSSSLSSPGPGPTIKELVHANTYLPLQKKAWALANGRSDQPVKIKLVTFSVEIAFHLGTKDIYCVTIKQKRETLETLYFSSGESVHGFYSVKVIPEGGSPYYWHRWLYKFQMHFDDILAEAGKRTGTCSICNRALTDPLSVERGIGPICHQRLTGNVPTKSTKPTKPATPAKPATLEDLLKGIDG